LLGRAAVVAAVRLSCRFGRYVVLVVVCSVFFLIVFGALCPLFSLSLQYYPTVNTINTVPVLLLYSSQRTPLPPSLPPQATMADTRSLVDFVLKCEGEWFGAGHVKKYVGRYVLPFPCMYV
jgi:hypothetical protein